MERFLSLLSRLCSAAVIAAAGSTVEAQTQVIKIRVINARNDRPMPHQSVSVALHYGKGETPPAKYEADLNLETDANGAVQVDLPEPAPAHFFVRVRITSGGYWHSRCLVLAPTQDLPQKGLVRPAGP